MSKRDKFIGIRFTKEEKVRIDKFIKSKNLTYNEFFHNAAFSYLNNLEGTKNKINLYRIQENMEKIKEILPKITRNVSELYGEFEEFKLNKDTYFIT